MVSTLMHLVWSLTFSKILRIKNVARFLFFGILLDFDFILDFFWKRPIDHRDYFHNIFFIIFLLSALWLWNRKKKDNELMKSAAWALSLHTFLDLFDGVGVPLFFPIWSERILLYPLGQNYIFPLKLIWEGNIYFTVISLVILFIVLHTYKHKNKEMDKSEL
ncbi:MAG: metal-dependent hydrolase [Nanoarchaeota archaeon]|nr:metal-dependent hydrolase [Nanoarchaeota archaeon]MBU4300095.1 metal-dependent hydrolase [Nanoarchaeota archaeon]MBU4452297.1 metal-dependent hydrolase [Nanoarchaeota archaeon]MCG2723822.1 metal-dependent hydrolase [archaeon]